MRGQGLSEDGSRPADNSGAQWSATLGLLPTTGVVSRNVMRNTPAVDRGVDWCRGIPSTVSAVCALAGVISAGHASVAPGRTYGKEKVYGSIP